MKSKIVHNYKITDSKVNFDAEPFKAHKQELMELVTDRRESYIDIDLLGITDRIANSIRRTLIMELDVKALNFDPSTVATTNSYSIRDELLNRVVLIPIHQDMPEDATFKLSVINTTREPLVVCSDKLEGEHSKYIPKKINLVKLPPGTYITIPEIRVITDSYAKRNRVAYQLTGYIWYDNLDFKDVDFINEKCNRVTRRVKVSDLLTLIKANTGSAMDQFTVYSKRILIIPGSDMDSKLSDIDKERIKNAKYDYIFTNKKEFDPNYLVEYSSTVAESTDFRLRIFLKGNIEPKSVVPMVCDNLISRLGSVASSIESGSGHVTCSEFQPQPSRTIFRVTIVGETHTIAEMISKQIMLAVPNIALVKTHMNHPSDKQIMIDIIHTEAKKIILDAIAYLISVFKQIKSELR